LSRWSEMSLAGKIPIHEECIILSLKSTIRTTLGIPESDTLKLKKIKEAYDITWHDMEKRVDGKMPIKGSKREEKFNNYMTYLHSVIIQETLETSKKQNSTLKESFLDYIREYNCPNQQIADEVMTHFVGGFHTTGNLLTWAFYFIAIHPIVQKNIFEEVDQINDIFEYSNLSRLHYTKQTLKETLRKSVLAPWAARFHSNDSSIGGYEVKKGTPVIQALGVCLNDPQVWKNPEQFDPERFSTQQSERERENLGKRENLAFVPFGYAGNRICPGQAYAYAFGTLVVAATIKEFVIRVDDSAKRVTPCHGLVTSPDSEIHLIFEKRKTE